MRDGMLTAALSSFYDICVRECGIPNIGGKAFFECVVSNDLCQRAGHTDAPFSSFYTYITHYNSFRAACQVGGANLCISALSGGERRALNVLARDGGNVVFGMARTEKSVILCPKKRRTEKSKKNRKKHLTSLDKSAIILSCVIIAIYALFVHNSLPRKVSKQQK